MDCNQIGKNIELYLDAELTLSDHRDFEEHICDCKQCEIKLEGLRSIKLLVNNSKFDSTPASLQLNIQCQLKDYTAESNDKFNLMKWLGLGGGAMVFGSFSTWLIMSFIVFTPMQTQLVDEVLTSHVRSLMVDHMIDVASSDRHTVKPWFNGRVNYSPTVRDLSQAGFKLLGGRLDYFQGKSVSALIYKRRAHIINTFIFKIEVNGASATQKIFQRNGYNLISWQSNGLEYWAISDLNLKELKEFSQLISSS